MLEFFSIDREVPNISSELFVLGINTLVVNEGFSLGNVNVVCVSDDYLLELNRLHLKGDYYTDIITFDFCEDKIVIGDLYISLDRVAENATDFNVAFKDEFARVVIHGVLHLCGYKDKSEEDELLMRSKENFYLKFCGFT